MRPRIDEEITFRKLEILLAFMETGNLTRAAEQLGISAVSVHRALHSLETGTRCTLFRLEGRNLQPNEAGQALADVAREVLRVMAEGIGSTRALAGYAGDRIRIGSLYSLTSGTVPALIMGLNCASRISRPNSSTGPNTEDTPAIVEATAFSGGIVIAQVNELVALGLKGKICKHWALNPHPALIPSIEAGWVETVHSFGSELGMEKYIEARSDVFFTGADGSLRSNRAFCQAAGHYACDLFIGSTLQIDLDGNSSTATLGRITGFGGAPNMGADARGRRHASAACLKAGREARAGRTGAAGTPRGQKLVVQAVETFREHMQPAFVERLDAWTLQEQAGMPLPPIMIYGDDVTHILTEQGIANLLLCRSDEEREQAIRGVAGFTAVGLARDQRLVENLRDRGVIKRPEDLGVDPRDATRNQLAARSMRDLVRASHGLYQPPKRFRNW